jgi:hypothetical protein
VLVSGPLHPGLRPEASGTSGGSRQGDEFATGLDIDEHRHRLHPSIERVFATVVI